MRKLIVLTVGSLLLGAAPLSAAAPEPAAKTGHWRFTMNEPGPDLQKIGAARQQKLKKDLQEIVKVVTALPVMKTPRGFEARFWGTAAPRDRYDICRGKDCPPARATAVLALMIGRYENRDGKIKAAFNKPATMDISVNNLGHVFANLPVLYRGDDIILFPEPQAAGQRAGMPAFLNNGHAVAVLTNSDQPLWRPVTREQYLQAAVASVNRELRDPNANSSGDRRMLMVEEGKTWLDPAKEKNRVEQSRSLAHGLREAPEVLQLRLIQLQGELDALPAEQRGLPARVELRQGDTGIVPQLLPADSTAGTAVVTPNFAYFSRKLPADAVQLLTVQWKLDGGPLYDPGAAGIADNLSNKVLLDIYRNLDWQKLRNRIIRTAP